MYVFMQLYIFHFSRIQNYFNKNRDKDPQYKNIHNSYYMHVKLEEQRN